MNDITRRTLLGAAAAGVAMKAAQREWRPKLGVLGHYTPANIDFIKGEGFRNIILSEGGAIDPAQPNFRREVEFQDDQKVTLGSGEINRIHMVRAGQKIDSDVQQVNFYGRGEKTIRVIVHNGDDPPLKITAAHVQQHERRVYFDSPGGSQLLLYYADPKLESPVYDYDKLFQRDPNATAAQLGAEIKNTAFTGRPDERPWSEKHPAVLWVAIVAAVLVLGALALRSMKTAAA